MYKEKPPPTPPKEGSSKLGKSGITLLNLSSLYYIKENDKRGYAMTVYPRRDNILFQKSQVLIQFLESLEDFCSNLLLLLSINLYVMLEINISLTVHWQEVDMCMINL